MKKLLLLLLALPLVFGACSSDNDPIYPDSKLAGLWQSDALEITIESPQKAGENVFWELTNDGTLTIFGTGDMYNWYFKLPNTVPWEVDKDKIKSVVIKEGVTSIGDYAFSNCYNLYTISLPQGVKKIGDNAFSFCIIRTIDLPQGIEKIGDSTFSNCKYLNTIYLPESLKEIGPKAFFQNLSLKHIYSKAPGSTFNNVYDNNSFSFVRGYRTFERYVYVTTQINELAYKNMPHLKDMMFTIKRANW